MAASRKVSPAFTALLLVLVVPAVVSAQRFFPLDPGNTWTYSSDRFGGTQVNSVLEVDENGVASFVRRVESNVILLVEDGDDVDIVLPDDDLQPFYRFGVDRWTHRDVDICIDGSMVTVGSRDEIVDTPVGVFEGCIRIDYGGGICSDAGIVAEWFAPDVGLVKWQEENITGIVTWTLLDFASSGARPFTRGDANESGNDDIADAVFVLHWLALGGREPSCVESADVNDDGMVDIADPIALLTFLFLGGFPPRAPFPGCGFDQTTTDDLTCESYRPCEG